MPANRETTHAQLGFDRVEADTLEQSILEGRVGG